MDYSDLYKIADSDIYICDNPLEGEYPWIHYYQYLDKDGNEYQIWQDQDGGEKVVEL